MYEQELTLNTWNFVNNSETVARNLAFEATFLVYMIKPQKHAIKVVAWACITVSLHALWW